MRRNRQGREGAIGLVVFLLACCGCENPFPVLSDVILRPSYDLVATPADAGYDYDEVSLPIGDTGRCVVVWHIPADNPKALVVIVPGSDANKSRYLEGVPLFLPEGYSLILMDYEGFGDSPGPPTMQAVIDDAFVVIDYALTLHDNVAVLGASIGTPATVRVAAERDLDAIILEGSLILYEEAELWLKDYCAIFHILPVWHIANFWMYPQFSEDYDIIRYVGQVTEPKLIMHSRDDEVTPYAGGVKVFEAAAEPKTFWEMYGGHGKMVRLETETYRAKVIGFLDRLFATP